MMKRLRVDSRVVKDQESACIGVKGQESARKDAKAQRRTRSGAVVCVAAIVMLVVYQSSFAQVHKGVYALTNARIETITRGAIERGTVVIRDGKIEAVGVNVSIPSDAETIDCAGLTLYPGFIDSGTQIGLIEIGSLSETRDNNELGLVNPHVDALTAVNPNSVEIPVTRVNGVTTVLTAPDGGLFSGTAALIDLVGYTPDQMYAGFKGMVMNFPQTGRGGWWDDRSDEEIEKAVKKAREQLKEVWTQAVLYAKIDSAYRAKPEADRTPEYSPKVQALAPVVRREMPLLIEVNAARDIDSAIAWVKANNVRAIFTGVSEGWRVADHIAAAGIPCLVGPVLSIPTRPSDRYDKAYANAGLLRKAGVTVAIRSTETSNARNLPYHAGFAAAYGMGRDEALRAVTIVPAQIFGVADKLGSIEPGKLATLFACDGDPFEPATNVRHVFIDGYNIPMDSRHIELYKEFIKREPGLRK